MIFSLDLLTEALLFGVLLGCFYAAVSIGLSVSFGLLDVPHVAHPAVMVLGSYVTYLLAAQGLDPIVAGVVLMPVFFLVGVLLYRFYYETFERRGTEAAVRGLAFAFGVALVLTFALTLYLSRTFTGRAIKAVAQDEPALRLMGVNPVRIKQWAFGIATAVSVVAGAMLIVVGPVEPAMDRVYIGRTFCVVVLAGLGSMTGTLVSGLILGVAESIVLMFFGASWAPAVAFGLLLVVLGIRPQGLFGR